MVEGLGGFEKDGAIGVGTATAGAGTEDDVSGGGDFGGEVGDFPSVGEIAGEGGVIVGGVEVGGMVRGFGDADDFMAGVVEAFGEGFAHVAEADDEDGCFLGRHEVWF